MPREYPPAVLVHAESCEDMFNLRRQGGGKDPDGYPGPGPRLSQRPEAHCNPSACRREESSRRWSTRRLRFEPSTVLYPDAARALAAVRMGTHGTLDILILPPGAQSR
jgi:hypothetical protein